jgi:predicted  nucleic acid-binding Zn-ribbon protein
MVEEMNTIPPRVNSLERELHTVEHRIRVLEDNHKDIPVRVLRLEEAIKDVPEIKEALKKQGDAMRTEFALIGSNFTAIKGMIMGAGAVWAIYQAGPQVLIFLGAR